MKRTRNYGSYTGGKKQSIETEVAQTLDLLDKDLK